MPDSLTTSAIEEPVLEKRHSQLWLSMFNSGLTTFCSSTVDGSEIRLTNWDVRNPLNTMINYLSTAMVQDFFHQQYVQHISSSKSAGPFGEGFSHLQHEHMF